MTMVVATAATAAIAAIANGPRQVPEEGRKEGPNCTRAGGSYTAHSTREVPGTSRRLDIDLLLLPRHTTTTATKSNEQKSNGYIQYDIIPTGNYVPHCPQQPGWPLCRQHAQVRTCSGHYSICTPEVQLGYGCLCRSWLTFQLPY